MASPKKYTLAKHEKLKGRTATAELFETGVSFTKFPVRVTYKTILNEAAPSAVKVGFACSKKHFKQAVKRNRIKRLMREAFRLQKQYLVHALKQNAMQLHVFFIFVHKALPTYADIEQAIKACLIKLSKSISAAP